jgi:hypothetical protein
VSRPGKGSGKGFGGSKGSKALHRCYSAKSSKSSATSKSSHSSKHHHQRSAFVRSLARQRDGGHSDRPSHDRDRLDRVEGNLNRKDLRGTIRHIFAADPSVRDKVFPH